MAKGRPPDPTRNKRGTGNRPKHGTAKVVKAAPVLHVKSETELAFPIPADLPEAVHEVWRAAVQDLGGANHMRETYLPALRVYCDAVHAHALATANINQYGVLVKGASGPIPNPLLKVQKDAAATMLRYAETLGLTPSGRIRLGLMEVTGMSLLASLNETLDSKRG